MGLFRVCGASGVGWIGVGVGVGVGVAGRIVLKQ